MNKLNALLLLAVFASSLVLVNAAYDTRRLRSELHRAELQAERLEGLRKQLEADRQQQATNLRVDATARGKLGMRPVSPGVTMYESVAGAAPGAPGASAVAQAAGAGAVQGVAR